MESVSLQELENFEKDKTDEEFFELLTKEIRTSGFWIQQKLFEIARKEMSCKKKGYPLSKQILTSIVMKYFDYVGTSNRKSAKKFSENRETAS